MFKSCLIFHILIFSCLQAQSTQNIEYFVHILASDSLVGRGVYTSGSKMAKDFIISELKKNQIKPFKFLNFSQRFCIPNSFAHNILFKIDNKQDSTILFIAHYDHLDSCSDLSKEVFKRKKCLIHNGADDNASGVAMLLDLAIHLNKKEEIDKQYNYVFAFTSAHEIGLLGAKKIVKLNRIKKLKIKAIMNFDMIGRLNKKEKNITIATSDLALLKGILSSVNSNGLTILFNQNQYYFSDLAAFSEMKCFGLSFTTGMHENYHTSLDDFETLNYEGILEIQKFIISMLRSL